MAKNTLVIDSDLLEASGFIKGVELSTNEEWNVDVEENNKIYGFRRYIKFFLVAIKIIINKKKYCNKTVLCWQQFYGIATGFLLTLLHIKKPFNLVVMTFIYKQKKGIIGIIYKWFVKKSISSKYIDKIICTTSFEVDYYSSLFCISKEKFVFVKWGILDNNSSIYFDEELQREDYFFTTGRSNRDYDFLVNAFDKTNFRLIIANDCLEINNSRNISVLNNAFGDVMLKYLYNCKAVVIALKDEPIASGQLVMLQAMCFGKPVIITDSKGATDDYLVNGVSGIVIKKDDNELLNALELLNSNDELYKNISLRCRELFEKEYTSMSLGENIGVVIKNLSKCEVK